MPRIKHTLLLLMLPLLVSGQKLRFSSFTTKDGLSNNYVEHIVQDKTGYLWVATRMGLNRFNGSKFRHFFYNPADSTSLPFNNILTLFVDNNNQVWMGGYGSQVASFNPNTERFTRYGLDNKGMSKDLDVTEIFSYKPKTISIVTQNGIYTLVNGVFAKDPAAPQHHSPRRDSLSYASQQWIAGSNGITQVLDNKRALHYTTENTPDLLSNSFKSVIKDRDGNLWFGSHSGGLVKLALQQEPLQFFSTQNIAIKNNITTSFYTAPDGKHWVASDGGGIAVFNGDYSLLRYIDVAGLPHHCSALDFAIDNNAWLWAASWQTGVFAINTKTMQTRSFAADFKQLHLTNDLKAVATKGETVYCGSYGDGLICINSKTGKIVSGKTLPNDAWVKSPSYINDLLVDSEGDLWIASTRGLYVYKNNRFEKIEIDPHDSLNAAKRMIWSVREGSNGRILIASSHCAFILHKKTRQIDSINLGLRPPYDVKFMFEDNKQQLWLGAYDELYLLPKNNAVASIKLTQSDFPIDVFSAGAVYQDAESRMFVGTQDGFYSFFPDSLQINASSPNIVFESFSRKYVPQLPGESTILKKHINECSEIALNHDDFPISLSFASIHYNQQTAIRFAYRLANSDTAWMPVTGKNELVFHQLQAGTYRLQLRNTNKYGKWNEQYRSLVLVVHPPFWQTWWFRTLLALLLVGAMILIYRSRVRRLRYQKAILTKEVAAQTQTLRLQNEEIGEQKKKLEKQADELQEKLLELHDQKEDLEALNAELSEQSEEMISTNSQLVSVIDTKNKLLSIIAHDVKNPFNVILLAAQNLLSLNKSDNNKEQREQTELIYSASKNVYNILSNLLDWALAQSGLLTSNPVHFNLSSFLQSMVENSKELTAQKNIHVSVSCNKELWCFADEQMIRIAIRNLFQNSVKFTPEGGLISILCSEDGSDMKIEIIDTGIGMDAATIEILFEINSIISEKGTRDEEGRGLGLLVVKEFVDKNNGRIEVKSKKNKGSNFIIWLPKGEKLAHTDREVQAPLREAIASKPIKDAETSILLIDDNAKLLEQLSKNLGEYYTVHAFSNAHDALAMCKTTKLDLVISDIVMGEIDGISLCKIIKTDLDLNIPVVLITGLDSSDMQAKAYNTGADAFIKKPFEFSVLLARVQNLLKQKHDVTKGFKLQTKLKPQDELFVERLKNEVEKGIPDAEFSVEILAQNMGYSRVNLFRKAKKALGISPSEYIQHARLEVAASLLKEKKYRVAEVAYMVGFSDPQYFSNCFTKHYGVSPGEYKTKQR